MKKILTVLLAVVLLAIGANAAFEKVNTYDNNFADVKDSNWFAKDVKSAYELGFMNGKAEGQFDPNGNVTIAEGITMAARVNAMFNGKEITKAEENTAAPAGEELRFDFDTDEGFTLNHAIGNVEGGVLVMQPDAPNAGGHFDLGVYLDDLSIDASVYKVMKVRMKRDELPNINERREQGEVFFSTETATTLGAEGTFLYPKFDSFNMSDWFEVTVDMSAASEWKGTVTRLRFDPTNNNGKYYIDYIVFTKVGAKVEAPKKDPKWYDMYVDYAVANGIVKKTTFGNYEKNISRADLVSLFAAALPEDYFAAINDVKGIPDVDKNAKYAKALLMLYKAGVVTGSDAEGTFNPTSDIKRSEVAAIINRVALPENRQKKDTITAVWEEEKPEVKEEPAAEEEHVPSPYDVEFDSAADLDIFAPAECDSADIEDGALVIIPRDRGPERQPQYDPRIIMSDCAIDAGEYKTLKIRLKADYASGTTDFKGDIYFMVEGDENFSEANSLHPDIVANSKTDAEGWLLVTIDLSSCKTWNGTVTAFRFDPANANGVYTFDYVRFAK